MCQPAQKDALVSSNMGKGFKEKLQNVSPCDLDDGTSLIFLQRNIPLYFSPLKYKWNQKSIHNFQKENLPSF